MGKLRVLHSEIDASVNFIEDHPVGYTEARYVRREKDYFICYLSSQTGCNRGCGFCHLTTTGQKQFQNVQRAGYLHQADEVLMHYESLKQPAKFVHFNMMSRGEALANDSMLNFGDEILVGLGERAANYGLSSKFNVSTIMPVTLKQSLTEVFKYVSPTIYYSLYSTSWDFRQKWMPGAMDFDDALRMLREYQEFSRKRMKIHFAFIKGQNDTRHDMHAMAEVLQQHNIECDINIVRYNPPDANSEESSMETIMQNVELLRSILRYNGTQVRIIPRVGIDVFASCGTFMPKDEV